MYGACPFSKGVDIILVSFHIETAKIMKSLSIQDMAKKCLQALDAYTIYQS